MPQISMTRNMTEKKQTKIVSNRMNSMEYGVLTLSVMKTFSLCCQKNSLVLM